MARFTKEDAREILRKCGIEMINAFMTDEVKKVYYDEAVKVLAKILDLNRAL